MSPSTLALRTVQRQTAASKSAKPLIREQQGSLGGFPRSNVIKPFSTLTQTPSLRASIGHLPTGGGFGIVGMGVGTQVWPQPLTMEKRSTLKARSRAAEAPVLDAMEEELCVLTCVGSAESSGSIL